MLALAAAAFTSTMAHGQDADTYPPTVPLMLPATDSFLQSFVRLINKSNQAGEVEITAVDDGGTVYDTVTVQLAANQTLHFNSGDLTDGNANKGIEGIGSPRQGNWRLSVETNLDVDVLSYVRARDGFLTATHEVLPLGDLGYLVKIFNPASNTTQQSRLRLINWGDTDQFVLIEGTDDGGDYRGPLFLTLPAGHSRTLTAVDLEQGTAGLNGTLGDGTGKWRLTIDGDRNSSIAAQSLLYASSGHISNLSDEGFSATQSGGITGRGGADCSHSHCYGAIAVIPNHSFFEAELDEENLPFVAGISWGFDDRIDANERALSLCGHSQCAVPILGDFDTTSFPLCAALAVGWNELVISGRRYRQWALGRDNTLREARFDALNGCRRLYDDCELRERVEACADGSHLD